MCGCDLSCVKQHHLDCGLQEELQADGVGDHIFLLRLAEVTASPRIEAQLVDVLRLNKRALAFARKVRAQLAAIVEQRVWPLVSQPPHVTQSHAANGHDSAEQHRSKRPREDAVGSSNCAQDDRREQRHGGERRRAKVPCPRLDAGREGEAADPSTVTQLRHALAVGYAPHLAKRMPMHNGYRTLAASKASVACATATASM